MHISDTPKFNIKIAGKRVEHTDTRISNDIYEIDFDKSVRSNPLYLHIVENKPHILAAAAFAKDTGSSPLLCIAKNYTGVKEMPGKAINPEIARWRKHVMSVFPSIKLDALQDDSSVCRLYLLEVLATGRELGQKYQLDMRATKDSTRFDPVFGKTIARGAAECGNVRPEDIVHLNLGGSDHWGMVSKVSANAFTVQSASQNGGVCEKSYSKSTLIEAQRPQRINS